jgi:hypothetical protein
MKCPSNLLAHSVQFAIAPLVAGPTAIATSGYGHAGDSKVYAISAAETTRISTTISRSTMGRMQ